MNKLLEYKIPIKRYWQLIVMVGSASIVLAVLILSLPILAITKSDFQFQQEFIGYFIFFPILSMYAMWFIFGYEKVIISENNLEHIKSNLIITTKRNYSISNIKSIEVVEKKYKTDKWIDAKRERIREKRRAFPFWIQMGQLKLITKAGEVTFFNGLSNSEIEPMQNNLENELNKRKHNTI